MAGQVRHVTVLVDISEGCEPSFFVVVSFGVAPGTGCVVPPMLLWHRGGIVTGTCLAMILGGE